MNSAPYSNNLYLYKNDNTEKKGEEGGGIVDVNLRNPVAFLILIYDTVRLIMVV